MPHRFGRLRSSWRTAAWLTPLAKEPTHSRRLSVAVVASSVFMIGLADYITGNRISLELAYLVPIIVAVAWLGAPAGAAVALASIVLRVAGDQLNGPYPFPYAAYWNRFTDLCVYLVLVGIVHGLILLFREMDRRVADRTEALLESNVLRERLEREILEIAARERSAVGRELHDDLGQQLVGTAFAAKVLAAHLASSDPKAAQDAESIVRYIDDGVAKTRQLARGLLVSHLEPSSLADELTALAARGTHGDVSFTFRLEGHPTVESPAAAVQLLRIAQEATQNAMRHAEARNVDIVLASREGATVLIVQDDGRGLPPNARGRGMGLLIMEHRAAVVGGALSIVARVGEGTRVVCHVPRGQASKA